MSLQTFEFHTRAQYVKIGETWQRKAGLGSSFNDSWIVFLTAPETLLAFDAKKSQCPTYLSKDDCWMPRP